MGLGFRARDCGGGSSLPGLLHLPLQLGRVALDVGHAPRGPLLGLAAHRDDHRAVAVGIGTIDTGDRGDGIDGALEEPSGAQVVEESPGSAGVGRPGPEQQCQGRGRCHSGSDEPEIFRSGHGHVSGDRPWPTTSTRWCCRECGLDRVSARFRRRRRSWNGADAAPHPCRLGPAG